jgi:soluble lytic murein transglycosylase-like protein
MSTGNHLTVRDYFDQALFGRQATRRALQTGKANSSGGTIFRRLLTSLGNQTSDNRCHKPTGLKVKDYLSNPVRVKCHYNYRLSPSAPEKKSESAKNASSTPPPAANMASKEKAIRKSHETKPPLPVLESTAAASARSELIEDLVIEKNIHAAARKYDLAPELLMGVIRAESNFEVRAVSDAGAQGLMQLMPQTARELGVDNPFDISQNIDGGARYLRKMLDKFDGDIKLALAAYNAGPGAVEKYGGQIPPYPETEQYIDRVLRFSKLQA